jgi:hypothetical protein
MHRCNTKKALAPVMSSGILICIAIAVTLATLAWMNGLPTQDIQTESLQLTSHQWGPKLIYVDVTLYNNGTQNVKINSVTVNSRPTTIVYIAGSNQINTGESTVLRIANTFIPEETYQLTFQTAKGTRFVHTVTA